MSTPEEFSPDYVEGYRDGMDRASRVVDDMRHTNPPVSKEVDRYLHTAARALKHGAETAHVVGTAQHALASLPTPDIHDKVRVTSPYCEHKGVGTLVKLMHQRGADDTAVDTTAWVVFDDGTGPWIGPMSAVVPA